MEPNKPIFSERYLNFAKEKNDLPPLTSSQHEFAEWLLSDVGIEHLSKINSITEVFVAVRKYVRNSPDKLKISK